MRRVTSALLPAQTKEFIRTLLRRATPSWVTRAQEQRAEQRFAAGKRPIGKDEIRAELQALPLPPGAVVFIHTSMSSARLCRRRCRDHHRGATVSDRGQGAKRHTGRTDVYDGWRHGGYGALRRRFRRPKHTIGHRAHHRDGPPIPRCGSQPAPDPLRRGSWSARAMAHRGTSSRQPQLRGGFAIGPPDRSRRVCSRDRGRSRPGHVFSHCRRSAAIFPSPSTPPIHRFLPCAAIRMAGTSMLK